MSHAAPRLAAVVVNHRTAAATGRAVESLRRSRRPVQDLCVVENGSGDGSEAWLRSALPGVRLLALPENRGFAGGANAGLRAVLADGAALVLLLNSDATVEPETLGHLEDALVAGATAGIAGPIVLSSAWPDRVLSLGLTVDPATGRVRERGHGWPVARAAEVVPAGTVIEVDAVSGCAMLLRREVVERAGLLDEAYFFSFEDVDLCRRARGAGLATLVVGAARARHEGSLTIGADSPRRHYFATRNHLRLVRGWPPPGPAFLAPLLRPVRSGLVLGYNLAHVLVSGRAPRLPALRAVARGALDHFRRRYGAGS